MKYVDVILPLGFEGVLTYSVPEALESEIILGVRVLVPLGKKKIYSGIVVAGHEDEPNITGIKSIVQIIDRKPILLEKQYRLWQWISDYYLCPIGDVYKAALPSGMKSTETFKPKTELYIRLCPPMQHEHILHIVLDQLARAPKQLKVLLKFLELSHWDTIESDTCREPVAELTRDELMNSSNATLAAIKTLVDKKIFETYEKEVGRLNDGREPNLTSMKQLNEFQTKAYDEILSSFHKKNVTLLHGVTSSGKTEIYIHLIEREIAKHKQVLYLLPEIALTVQIMERLKAVFGNKLGIYHSKYSDAERVEIWNKQLSDTPYDIILGARSALFLPFHNLGLVIVDEEHETSFKQQDPAPRYHARSAAIVLAQMYQAKTLLGTATPSAESYQNALSHKYGYVSLNTRYQGIELPHIQIVDIHDLRHRRMMKGPFSPQLLAEVRRALDSGEQVLLFQNRRGFAPMIECHECGWVPKCTNCDVSLTLHKGMNQLTCHYCGYTYSVPDHCPNCGNTDLRGRGFGTEKIESLILEMFPEAKVARMDLDTTRTRSAYERIISDFSVGRTDILIGTQMVSKGLDFDKVSVVGILNADSMLNYPDFRAYEHAFTMMEQVSGRAGRKGKQGLVILQTSNPTLPLIHDVVKNDYTAYFKSLCAERKLFHYPPFYRLIYIFIKHRNEQTVNTAAVEMGSRMRQVLGDRVLGPDKPPVARVQGLYIRKLMLKLEMGLSMKEVRVSLRRIQTTMLQYKEYASLQMYYDVDPL
jgi:primosomal protein N' (replication factor Y)